MFVAACGGGGGGGGVGGDVGDVGDVGDSDGGDVGGDDGGDVGGDVGGGDEGDVISSEAKDSPGDADDPVPEPCTETAEGCLTQSQYYNRLDAISRAYRGDRYFKDLDQWELGFIRADEGYAHLALAQGGGAKPGKGVTVGMLDTGIDTGHPAFANKQVTETFYRGATDEPTDCTPEENRRDGWDSRCYSHGTTVASFLAADRTGIANNPHGIAWGADLVVFALPIGSGRKIYTPISLGALDSVDGSDAILFRDFSSWSSGARSLDFVNVSISYSGLITGYSAQDLRTNYDATIAALAQASRRQEDRTVFVMAGGNSNLMPCTYNSPHCRDENGDGEKELHATELELWAGLPARIAELRGHIVSVVAVDRNGDITSFSNRCGIAEDWCVAAPGSDLKAIFPGNEGANYFTELAGTSYAAPLVTGSLAVIKHLFRNQLSNVDLATRLLHTANKTGKYANSAIYGQGLLDLGAAMNPVGALTFGSGSRVGGGGGSGVQHTRFQAGTALGDGLVRSLAGRQVAAFDELGAPFWMELSGFASIPRKPPVGARIRDFMAQAAPVRPNTETLSFNPSRFQFGFLKMPKDAGVGHLAFTRHAPGFSLTGKDGFSAAAFSTAGIAGLTQASGVMLAWRPRDTWLGLRTGWLAEHKTLLGSSAKGAFGKLLADSAFVGIESDAIVDGWHLSGSVELGMVAPDARSGMIRYMSPLTTSAVSLRAARWLSRKDVLRFSVSQPLRVESGHAMLLLPVGRTKSGDILHEPVMSGLAPTGRQIEVAASWFRSSIMDSELRLGVNWTYNPNHYAGADADLTLFSGWRFAF